MDPEAATWLDEWRRSGGPSRRKGSTIAEGGARELKLVMKHQKRQRSLRDLDQNINSPPRVAEERSYVVRDDDDDDHAFGPTPDITLDGSDPLLDTFLSAASEFAALRASRPVLGERIFSIKDIGTNRVLSTSGSFGVFSDADTSIEIETPQIEDVIAMLETSEGDELLASPIELDAGEVEAVKQRLIESEKRGSGWVMSDQLDDLAKRDFPRRIQWP